MTEVAVCPRCHGNRVVDGHSCPTCNGEGVVWRTTQEAASRDEDDGPLDLTFRT